MHARHVRHVYMSPRAHSSRRRAIAIYATCVVVVVVFRLGGWVGSAGSTGGYLISIASVCEIINRDGLHTFDEATYLLFPSFLCFIHLCGCIHEEGSAS